ncbi:hypothetical protein N1031_04800 [Herbiconiux moechotypicola]|uniref:Uncharacterized protein n=1 Tax=Herbiconiux moechotypicola TaxID=637393 RepID=A0ABN3D9N8_9MICO|nr:hypothetical protein [Herbiconiux moechotypicola]MCS5729071.1 hypothetical protein [Herbiconiux moechotypicola]
MTIALVFFVLLALAGIVGTLVELRRDGHRRVPTRPTAATRSETPAELAEPSEPVVSARATVRTRRAPARATATARRTVV